MALKQEHLDALTRMSEGVRRRLAEHGGWQDCEVLVQNYVERRIPERVTMAFETGATPDEVLQALDAMPAAGLSSFSWKMIEQKVDFYQHRSPK